MRFMHYREELAGVLCHETSHDIHHDVLHLYQKQQRTATVYTIGDFLANLATGGKCSGVIDTLANVGFQFQALPYSRDVEAAAAHKGAITCAQAGSNPWGMVWLFERFEKIDTNAPPELISDHPTNQARIAALEQEFRSNVALFGRYSPNIATATPLTVAANRTAAARAAAHKPVAK